MGHHRRTDAAAVVGVVEHLGLQRTEDPVAEIQREASQYSEGDPRSRLVGEPPSL